MTFAISSSDSSWTSKLQFIPNALQLSRFFIAPSLFDGHLLCLLPGLFGPGEPDSENPVPELRPGLVRLHVRRQGNGTGEGFIRTFHPVVILLLDLFLLLLFSGECERVFRQVHLDVLFLQAGQLHVHNDIVPVPEYIHRGGDLLHFGGLKPRPPRRTEEVERPPEEILKTPLEFLDRGNPFCGLRLRQFLRLLLRHESPPALHNLGNNPCLPASEGRNRPGMIRTNQSCPLHAGWRVRCRLSPSLRCGSPVSWRSRVPD